MHEVRAKWYHPDRRRQVRVVVIHDMEAPETATTAESVARYFSTVTRKASAHVCVDANSEVRCVPDNATAFHAAGANADGLGIEHAGYARQTRDQWLDPYGKAMLARSVKVVAAWCRKYDIPPRRLTVGALQAGHRGITGHAEVSLAYRQSTHTDPGPNFPWDYYLTALAAELAPAPPAQEDLPVDQKTFDALLLNAITKNENIRAQFRVMPWQQLVGETGVSTHNTLFGTMQTLLRVAAETPGLDTAAFARALSAEMDALLKRKGAKP